MDFRIPGLPHSVVKHAQSTSVRALFQKIENHPDRHALQQDLRQNEAENPFCPESKKMIQDLGNIELCELFETEGQTQCKACLSYWKKKASSVARAGISCTKKQRSIENSLDVIKKRRLHCHRYGKKPGDKEYYLANLLKKKCKKKKCSKESMTDSYEIMSSVFE